MPRIPIAVTVITRQPIRATERNTEIRRSLSLRASCLLPPLVITLVLVVVVVRLPNGDSVVDRVGLVQRSVWARIRALRSTPITRNVCSGFIYDQAVGESACVRSGRSGVQGSSRMYRTMSIVQDSIHRDPWVV